MNSMPHEVLRQYVREQKFTSTTEVLNALKSMFKEVIEESLVAELEEHLGYEKYESREGGEANSRNGYNRKKVKSQLGEIEIQVPRDRAGEFEPKLIGKYQRNITDIEDKIVSLYARGMTTRDIEAQMQELYGVEISAELVSRVTNRILPVVTEWQNRPLDEEYPFVFMDAIHYKLREEKHIVKKAAYVVLGVNEEGYKDVLGIWVGANESSKFWLSVLGELKNRGVKRVNIFCVDGLNGFKEAIAAVYPQSLVQRCIIHQLRASTRYVSYKDIKEFSKDLRGVYTAASEEEALEALGEVKEKWNKQYPGAIKSWEANWDDLSTFFAFPPEIRRIIYTTNAIESLHSQFRKVTKTKLIFPNDDSLMKMLYLATEKVVQKWTQRLRDWDLISHQLQIIFAPDETKC